jgi:HSP20 family protein
MEALVMANIAHYDSLDLIENLMKNVFRPVGFDTRRFARPQGENGLSDVRLLPMDVLETDQAYRVLAELPGIKKEDVSVSIDRNRLTLAAESRLEKNLQENGERVLSQERFVGKLQRSVQFPEEIDEDASQAKYVDGVLELTLPKKKPHGVKKLEIQ